MASKKKDKKSSRPKPEKAKKAKKASWISGIRIGFKRLLTYVVIILPFVYVVSELRSISSEIQSERKSEIETTMISVIEQYTNASIENMVDIAKTVTKNDKLYEFLNTYYKSSREYSEAYQQLRNSRTLAISDAGAIRELSIYTENASVLNGGMINSLTDSVKATEWYYDLMLSGKNTILFCDSFTGNLSLVRKMDLYPLKYGDSIIKIDFSMAYFKSVFDNISFKGKIYISGDHSLLYSNDKNASYNSIYDYPSGQLAVKTQNFYSTELRFYVYADCEDTFNRMIRNPMNITCASLIFLAAAIAFYISADMRKRIGILIKMCRRETDVNSADLGKDEIGRLHEAVSEIIEKYTDAENLNTNIRKKFEEDRKKILLTERAAYDFDTRMSFLKLTDRELLDSIPNADELVSFSRELKRVKNYIDIINTESSSGIQLITDTSQSEPDDMYIIPYGFVMTVACIEKMIRKKDFCIEMAVVHNGPEIGVSFKIKGEKLPEQVLSKLSAVCLSSFDDLPAFKKGGIYNSFIRIRKYYNEDIRFIISAENDTEIKLLFRAPRMFRKYFD